MEIAKGALSSLAKENIFSKNELRVWLFLMDNICSPTELVRQLNISQSQIYKVCKKLDATGWIEVKAELGNKKWYRAKIK